MTGQIEQRLEQLGLVLPAQLQLPAGLSLPFSWARVIGNRVVLSGHLPTNEDGSLWLVTGKVGSDVNIDQAYQAARQPGSDHPLGKGTGNGQCGTRFPSDGASHEWLFRTADRSIRQRYGQSYTLGCWLCGNSLRLPGGG